MAFNGFTFALFVGLARQVATEVRSPPSIVEKFADNTLIFRDGNAVVLPCKATGEPLPTYQWLKNGEPLNVNVVNIHLSEDRADGSLTIDPPTILDEGYFQCVAQNPYGKSISNVVKLQQAVLQVDPGQDRPYTVKEGSPLIVQCNPPRRSVPRSTFSWALATSKVDPKPRQFVLNQRVQTDSQGNLYFAHVLPSDAQGGKFYKCNAFNAYTDTRAGSSYSTIQVIPDPSAGYLAPTLKHATRDNTVVLLGETLILTCLFSGKPAPLVSWSGPDNVIAPGRHEFAQYHTELRIKRVTWVDQGVYRCQGTNDAGTISHEINIKVQVAPTFTERPFNTNVTEGDDAVFVCRADAKPSPIITWYINGEPFSVDDTRDRMEISEDGSALFFRDTCKTCADGSSDLRVVQCNASNIHGYVFADAYINVLEPTVILNGPKPMSLTPDNATEINFDCEAKSDPSTPVHVTWYHDDKALDPDTHARISISPNQALLVNLTGLEGDDLNQYAGQYKCRATNGYNAVEGGAMLTVILPQMTTTALPMVTEDLGPSSNTSAPGVEEQTQWQMPLWVLILIALLAAILLVLLILCCCYWCKRGRKVDYKVDEKERAHGLDPVNECNQAAFMVYHKPELGTLKHSRAPRSSYPKLDSSSDSGRGSNDNLYCNMAEVFHENP